MLDKPGMPVRPDSCLSVSRDNADNRSNETCLRRQSMPEFPSGTVAFIFTDIAGSTALRRNGAESDQVVPWECCLWVR